MIEVDSLAKTYRAGRSDAVRAVDGVSFSVPEGKIFGLLGPNGAGKTTLIRMLTTITEPTGGRAAIRGFDIALQPLEVRRQIAVVLQQAAVETMLTVEDNLMIYAYLHGVGRRDARARIRAVVDEFDLGEQLNETVQDLSIGTKRRVQVAKIFMVDAPVIFLDEASTGMDPIMKRRVMDRIRREARAGRTVLITTQILSEAEQLCDTIMIVDKGKTLAAGTLPELRRLAMQMFRVSLTFADMTGELRQALDAMAASELKVEGRQADMVFRGEEADLLGRLAEIARVVPITHFEVRGADLEEIFVELVQEKR